MIGLPSLRIAALVVVCAAGGFGVWWVMDLRADRDSARIERDAALRDLAGARAVLAQQAEAAAVHRVYLRDAAAAALSGAALARDLEQMEGRDAPLSDHLRRAAGRVWP